MQSVLVREEVKNNGGLKIHTDTNDDNFAHIIQTARPPYG